MTASTHELCRPRPQTPAIVKPAQPPAGPGAALRRRDGQPGHAKHERAPFHPEQVTLFAEHPLRACPCCGGPLRRNGGLARVVQQVDFQQPPLTVAQYTSPEYWCEHCARPYKAALPAAIETGACSARG
jgi:transposase